LVGAILPPELVLGIIEAIYKVEITDNTTVDQFFDELLDISLSFSEDCLHLAVYTPEIPEVLKSRQS
jgi:hypothetical protein